VAPSQGSASTNIPHAAMRNLSWALWNTTPSEGGVALAELARLRFAPTTSYGGGRSDTALEGPDSSERATALERNLLEQHSDKTEPLKTS
jgi:hypothetical protein